MFAVRLSIATLRLLLLLLTRRWGLCVIGAFFIVGGLIYGFLSHQVIYQSITSGRVESYFTTYDGTYGYLQMADSPDFYAINQSDTNPIMYGVDTFQSGDVVSFVYRANVTNNINTVSDSGQPIEAIVYNIVEITQTNDQGQVIQTYTTPDFVQHPHSYNENHWPVGSALLAIGVAFIVIVNAVAFILKRYKKQIDIDVNPSKFMMPLGQHARMQVYQQPEIVLYPQNTLQPDADELHN